MNQMFKNGKTVLAKLKMSKLHFLDFILIYYMASLPYCKELTLLIL